MFQVNNKNTKTTPMMFVPVYFNNFEHISRLFGGSFVNFEHTFVEREAAYHKWEATMTEYCEVWIKDSAEGQSSHPYVAP